MLRGYIFILGFVVCIRGFVIKDVQCNYIYGENCVLELMEDPPGNYSSLGMSQCNKTDISTQLDFFPIPKDNKTSESPGMLRVDFIPPTGNCKFGVSLLANDKINGDTECKNHEFDLTGNIEAETHTTEETICIAQNGSDDPLENGHDVKAFCQGKMQLWFQYIFTGCYAVRFHFGGSQYVISEKRFLQMNYKRTEVQEPYVECSYDILPAIGKVNHSSERILFATNVLMLADTGPLVELRLFSELNQQEPSSCFMQTQIYASILNVKGTLQEKHNCTMNMECESDGKAMKNLVCSFAVESASMSPYYCLTIRLLDERCKRKTLWQPPGNQITPCAWVKRCLKMSPFEYKQEVTTNSNLLLPILVIVSTMFTMSGVIYMAHWLRMRNDNVLLYTCKKGHRANLQKSKVPNLEENDIEYKDADKADIVLLYPKGSVSFMALLADFRGILGRVCGCSVHDWHDGTVWNHVARVGAPDWFREMLRNECSIIWIDTPITRSLLSSEFRNSNSGTECEKKKCVEFGDFRDVVFPAILNMAKKNVQESESSRSRHFVVRFKGFEGFEDDTDPFVDLSPEAFYLMPEDLSQLCSHLFTIGSTINSSVFARDTKHEEDFIRHHLTRVKCEP